MKSVVSESFGSSGKGKMAAVGETALDLQVEDGARFLILQTLLAAYTLIGALGLLPPLNLTQSFTPPDPPPSMVLEQRKGVCFWYTFFAKSKSVQGQIYSSHASPPAHEKLFMQGCRIVPAFSLRTQSGNMNWRVQDSLSPFNYVHPLKA